MPSSLVSRTFTGRGYSVARPTPGKGRGAAPSPPPRCAAVPRAVARNRSGLTPSSIVPTSTRTMLRMNVSASITKASTSSLSSHPLGAQHVALEAHVVGLGGREGGEVVPAGQGGGAGVERGAVERARPPQRAVALERAAAPSASARGSGRCGSARRGGRRSRPAPARSRARSRRRGSTPFSERARRRVARVARHLAARVHAAVGAAGHRQGAPRAAAPCASASSSTPCTVRRPGWRAQPANSEPSYSSSSRAARALPALARDDHHVLGLDPQRAVVGRVAALAAAPRSAAQLLVALGRERLPGGGHRRSACALNSSANASRRLGRPDERAGARTRRARRAARAARAPWPRRPTPPAAAGPGRAARSARPTPNSSAMTPSGVQAVSPTVPPGRTTRNSSRAATSGRGARKAPNDGADAVEAGVLERAASSASASTHSTS